MSIIENHMSYLPNMEQIDSDIMEKVLFMRKRYDAHCYKSDDVKRVIMNDYITIEDFGVLLSVAAAPFLEQMAVRARMETRKHFGNSVYMFTPIYISNYCENHCVYCGFNCHNKIHRAKLRLNEIDAEMKAIANTGLREILILTGESRNKSDVEYIGEAVKIAAGYFSTIGIEIYPLNTWEYSYLRECGADFVSVYQETYNTDKYEKIHLSGNKRCFPYRFYSQERAALGGMRGAAFGVLLGLDDFRKDAFATGVHAFYTQKKYPHMEISFSCPRIRPYINNLGSNSNNVHESQLLQVMMAYRIFMPYAGLTISTRERAGFRDNVIGMCATKISAGVKVGIGGHENDKKGDEQFEISDARNVKEVHDMIENRGLQPVYTDYIRV